jgi:ATP-binding cassette subfamily B protein
MTVLSNSLWALKFIFSIARVYSVLFVLARLYNSFEPLITSYISARIIDNLLLQNITPAERSSLAVQNVVVLFLVMAFGNITLQIAAYCRSHIGRHLRIVGFEKIYEKASSLSLSQLEDPEVNNLMKRANDNIRTTLDLYRSLIFIFTETISFIADALIILAFLPLYILGYSLFSILYFFPIRYFIKKDFLYQKEQTEPYRKAMSTAAQLTDATYIKEIRVNESYSFFDRFFKNLRINYLAGLDDIRMKWGIAEYFLTLPLLGVHFFGYMSAVYAFLENTITLGTMTFRFSSISRFNSGLSAILQEMNYVSEFSLSINECRMFLNLEPQDSKGIKKMSTKLSPELDIRNLTFNYKNSEAKVIKNLNLHIRSGEKIAIVGHNGAGKTTLIKLLSKVYDVSDGEILVNGININEVSSDNYYKNLGVLFQDFVNYGQISIRDNIALEEKRTQVSDRDVIKAAKLADAHDFIQELPNKYDTIPNERYKGGVRLSGGQGQKLALARFFYKDAPLLIFDEPTSAIDAVSEFKIFNNIYEFFKDKTVIIISHRFSTVRNADRIIVMAHGEIVEEGNHKELMEKNGVYAESYNLQAGSYGSQEQPN